MSPASSAGSLTHVSTRRRVKNLVMTLLMGLALVVVGGLLVLVLITVVGKGIGIVFHDFPAWFTEDISPSTPHPGRRDESRHRRHAR